MEVEEQYVSSYCPVSSSSLSGETWDLAALTYVVPGVEETSAQGSGGKARGGGQQLLGFIAL